MRNLTLLTDLYELTMMYGYYKNGTHKNQTVFDMFFRQPKNGSAYALAAGLEQVIDYINDLHFDEDSIGYLRSLKLFDEEFLNELRTFKFTGEIYAVPEGTVVFPYEPLVRVKAPIFEAQLLETAILNIVNHQTLIATKASRVKYAAGDADVMEFGLRRLRDRTPASTAQGPLTSAAAAARVAC
jgi:nicotinate phosphoribosyltransferase